jgi:hypothetical protein
VEKAMIIGQTIAGEKVELDLPTLVDTRLLIQANSGGGKSWLLRLIAERAGIQTISPIQQGRVRESARSGRRLVGRRRR